MLWKVYYDDGTTFSDLDGKPEDAPCRGVQAIVKVDDVVGRLVCRSNDFYVWFPHGWEGVDQFGLWDYLADPGLKIVKFGRIIEIQDYQKLLNIACEDPDFPRKSASYRTERS